MHLLRAGLCAFVLLNLFSFSYTTVAGAAGRNLFQWIASTTAIFATICVPLLFASTVTEEKEAQTMALLRIANVNALTIISGKAIPRLTELLLILLALFPFTLLAITLGGLTYSQILPASLMLMAYVFALSGIAVWCSVICQTTRKAAALTLLVLIGMPTLLTLVWIISDGLLASSFGRQPGLALVRDAVESTLSMNVFPTLSEILSIGYSGTLLPISFWAHLLFGLCCYCGAWWTFDLFNRTLEPTASPRKKRNLTTRDSAAVWSRPLAWKDFQFLAGGRRWLLGKLAVYFLGVLALSSVTGILLSNEISFSSFGWWAAASMFFFVIPLEISLAVGRSVNYEVQEKTLSSLMMLPMTTREVYYEKLAGSLLGLVPAFILLGIGTALTYESLISLFVHIEFFGVFATTLVLGLPQLLIYWHLVALMSLSMNPWWAVGVALFIYYVCASVLQMIAGLIMVILAGALLNNSSTFNFYLMLGGSALLSCGILVAMHVHLGREIERKAASEG